jgi:hypothetical protein
MKHIKPVNEFFGMFKSKEQKELDSIYNKEKARIKKEEDDKRNKEIIGRAKYSINHAADLLDENLDPLKIITNEPVIKFNGGNPVCLCTQCRIIIERVKYNENTKSWTTLVPDTTGSMGIPLLCRSCKNKSFVK